MKYDFREIANAMICNMTYFLNKCNCSVKSVYEILNIDQNEAFAKFENSHRLQKYENEIKNEITNDEYIEIPKIDSIILKKLFIDDYYYLLKQKLNDNSDIDQIFKKLVDDNSLISEWNDFLLKKAVAIAKNWILSNFNCDYLYDNI